MSSGRAGHVELKLTLLLFVAWSKTRSDLPAAASRRKVAVNSAWVQDVIATAT